MKNKLLSTVHIKKKGLIKKMENRLTWNEIKKIYKNEYVGLTNVYYKNNDNVTVESAIVQYTSKDTNEAKLLEMASNNEIYLIYITDEFDEGGYTL